MSKETQIAKTSQPEFSLKDLVARLKKREAEIDELCEGAVKAGFRAIGMAFDQGDDLIAAKAQCKHGEFEQWIEDNFKKGYWVANRYMKLAALPKVARLQLLNDAKSINDCFRTLGIIAPEPEKQVATLPHVNLPPIVQKLVWIGEYYQRTPPDVEAMTPDAREELKAKLRPVNEIFLKL